MRRTPPVPITFYNHHHHHSQVVYLSTSSSLHSVVAIIYYQQLLFYIMAYNNIKWQRGHLDSVTNTTRGVRYCHWTVVCSVLIEGHSSILSCPPPQTAAYLSLSVGLLLFLLFIFRDEIGSDHHMIRIASANRVWICCIFILPLLLKCHRHLRRHEAVAKLMFCKGNFCFRVLCGRCERP